MLLVDVSNFPIERDLIALKAEVDKLDMKGTLIKI